MTPATRQRLATVPWHLVSELAAVLGPALDAVLSNAPAEDVLDRLLKEDVATLVVVHLLLDLVEADACPFKYCFLS